MTQLNVSGFEIHKGYLDPPAQTRLVEDVRNIVRAAPLFSPVTPRGKPMSVRMTAAGDFGWITDRRGYRYQRHHPDGQDWPAIPASVLDIWHALSGVRRDPECCLINYYGEEAVLSLATDISKRKKFEDLVPWN